MPDPFLFESQNFCGVDANSPDNGRQSREDGSDDERDHRCSEGTHLSGLHLIKQRCDVARKRRAEGQAA
jgi:hypothetical protein